MSCCRGTHSILAKYRGALCAPRSTPLLADGFLHILLRSGTACLACKCMGSGRLGELVLPLVTYFPKTWVRGEHHQTMSLSSTSPSVGHSFLVTRGKWRIILSGSCSKKGNGALLAELPVHFAKPVPAFPVLRGCCNELSFRERLSPACLNLGGGLCWVYWSDGFAWGVDVTFSITPTTLPNLYEIGFEVTGPKEQSDRST